MSVSAAFRGFIETTFDALLIFEGCRAGVLPKINRRLQEFEKKALIVSGAVFVFDEEETGIKRWTDGLNWSPSRTLGNFLIYRELDKGEKRGNLGASGDTSFSQRSASEPDPDGQAHDVGAAAANLDRARERALVGSLTSTYRFRGDGLVKKTISLAGMHMIAYYRIDDVTSGRLRTPSSLPELASLDISPMFLVPSLFRVPPRIETGYDGRLRYVGEGTELGSSQTSVNSFAEPARLPPLPFNNPQQPYLTAGSSIGADPANQDFGSMTAPSPSLTRRPTSSSSLGRAHPQSQRSGGRFEPYSGRPLSSSLPPTNDYAGSSSGLWTYSTAPGSSSSTHEPPPPFGALSMPTSWQGQGSLPPLAEGRSNHRLSRSLAGPGELAPPRPDPPKTSESAQFSFQRPRTGASDTSALDPHGSPGTPYDGPFSYTGQPTFDPRLAPAKASMDYWPHQPSADVQQYKYGVSDRFGGVVPAQFSPRPSSSSSSAASSYARPPTAPWTGSDAGGSLQRSSISYDAPWAPKFPSRGSDAGYAGVQQQHESGHDLPYGTPGQFPSFKRPTGLVGAPSPLTHGGAGNAAAGPAHQASFSNASFGAPQFLPTSSSSSLAGMHSTGAAAPSHAMSHHLGRSYPPPRSSTDPAWHSQG